MTIDEVRRAFLRDVADILSKDDDLCPHDEMTQDGQRWQKVRDRFVAELQRRSIHGARR